MGDLGVRGWSGLLRGWKRSPTYRMAHAKLLRLAENEVARTMARLPAEVREGTREAPAPTTSVHHGRRER